MTREPYAFYLRVDDGGRRKISPIYTNAHQRDDAPVGDSRYFRPSITEPFTLTRGNGYEDIQGQPIGRNYFLDIYEITPEGESLFFAGKFSKTDCDINEDEKRLDVVLQSNDQYSRWEDDLDTERDLATLNVATRPVSYKQFAILQVYDLGAKTVTNVVDGTATVTSSEPVESLEVMTEQLNFGGPTSLMVIPYRADYPENIAGTYRPTRFFAGNPIEFTRADNAYTWANEPGFTLLTLSDNTGRVVAERRVESLTDIFDESLTFIVNPSIKAYPARASIFGRVSLVRNMAWPNAGAGQPRPRVQNGPFEISGAYDRTVPFSVDIIATQSYSEQDQGFGRFDVDGTYANAGKFVAPPADGNGIKYFPVGRDKWKDVAFWFVWDSNISGPVASTVITITIPDAYPLENVIRSMAQAIDPELTFEPTPEHSRLLFGETNPITGRPRIKYAVIPAGNVLVYDYDTPVSKIPLKMSDIVQGLRFVFQAEPFIDPDLRLRIESVAYFENGKSYDGPQSGADLTTSRDPFTGRLWVENTNRYTYDKSRLPGRLVFGWANDSSPAFDGQDIVATSGYVDTASKEDRKTGTFVTDLQLALTRPGVFAQTSLFLLACREDADGRLVVLSANVPGFGVVQNGDMAWPSLHAAYYLDAMPGRDLLINGAPAVARSVRRSRLQEIEAPLGPDYVPGDPIKTSLGNGLPSSTSTNMITKITTTTLRHGTD